MSKLTIEESLVLGVPPDVVWRALLDPETVASCLPGASLEGADDERTFRGSMRVSVGPVSVAYRGTIVFEEIDPAERRVRVSGRGREATGSGSATLSMESRVSPRGDGSLVTVHSEVQVTGKLVSFGRGMIERVSVELFREFTSRLEETLAAGGQEPAPGAEASAPPAGAAEPRNPPGRGGDAGSLGLPRLLWRVVVGFVRDLLGRSPRARGAGRTEPAEAPPPASGDGPDESGSRSSPG